MYMSHRRRRGFRKTGAPYLAFLLTLAMLAQTVSLWADARTVDPGFLRLEFIKLKTQFETEAKKTTEQKVLAALALKTAALSWAMAASNISERGRQGEPEWAVRIKTFEKDWANTANLEKRELFALEFYYEAMSDVTWALAGRNRQAPLLAELETLSKKTSESLVKLDDKDDGGLERRVIISGALASMVSLSVRSVGGGAMEQPVQVIMKDMINKANDISERSDAHYRAKLSLLYSNNAQGLTSLIFLLGRNAGPALNRELAAVHSAWNQHGAGGTLPDAMSLTWAAQAQASLPLAFWLATH